MADKPKKPQKLRARLPRGLGDRGPADIAATRRMTDTIREVYERYGFEPVETPTMEFTDALGKFLPDQDRPNEGVFSFQDDDEQWISLRYDLTAPLARYVAEHWDALPKPYRSYRAGYVYRNEKPGPGRFRQFMQFDADTVGSASPAADAEMCMMAADAMEKLGIQRAQYVVKVNNRKVLDGVMESIGLGGDENAARRLIVLRAIDKMDKFPVDDIKKLLGAGRWDGGEEGKGDFTKGAGLQEEDAGLIIDFVTGEGETWADTSMYKMPTNDEWIKTGAEMAEYTSLPEKPGTFFYSNDRLLSHWSKLVSDSEVGNEGIKELRKMLTLMESAGYGSKRFRVTAETVRGLEYYTGPVYEVELTLETKDEKGRPVRFGSVGGGGRYDGLVSRFRGEPVPATGFSIGVSRLQAALTLLGKIDTTPQPGPVIVTVFGGEIAGYQAMVAQLRQAGIRAELYLGNPKHALGQQMKYADKRNSPCAIIQGSDEKAGGKLLIKDLIAGAGLTEIKDREEYLRKQAEAQIEIAETDLVSAVRKILDKHGVKWSV
ncbi:HisS family protein [Tardiphaga sp. 42S5]|uniref:histidine--tRNA ligase n=1 Tax=Tardiphaga sp. 42S5 TaxID=1404799 RepID=UPI002A5AF5F5|nr:HisS family protein [Tardiphaga sp. 42S5]WPO43486.1 HisS family protein [Tardiphaga sp. 42S5]